MMVAWVKLSNSARTAHAVRVISETIISKKAMCGVVSNNGWAKSNHETKCALCHRRVAKEIQP